jgi:transcriptional regulator with XRE-family HTH domain
MTRYFDTLDMPGKRLAGRAGVSHSQIYMARNRHVGAKNAEKIVRAISGILGLSFDEEMELKAEIMGEPDNLVHAYVGNSAEAADLLCEEQHVGRALINGEPLAHKTGTRVLAKLESRGAPETVISSVHSTVQSKASPPGRITYTLTGPAVRRQRERAWEKLESTKPGTHAAIEASGLSRKEIHERANIGRETLRQALYESCGVKAATAISDVLAETASLSREEQEAVRSELQRDPEEFLENF